jgi:hypothetical protein
LVETLRGMLPLMRLYGIASEEEIGIDELAVKIQTEAAALVPIVILTPLYWSVGGAAKSGYSCWSPTIREVQQGQLRGCLKVMIWSIG